jgi:UDP-3-O-[3-hydroxymyristoyl] N-acetylglucosamine deacetylase/3-hydroxyacyl-[acyl-carrier-protein] dehydratase
MKRKTISSSVEFEGIGLHSGKHCKVKIVPSDIGKGIKFIRTDLAESRPINADISTLNNTNRCTVLGKDDNTISTVEHLLATLYSLEINDVLIEVNGPEIPILDGSALPFYQKLNPLVHSTELDKEEFIIDGPLHFQDEDSGAEYYIYPADHLSIQTMVKLNNENWPNQMADLHQLSDFEKEIAPARTYVFAGDLIQLYENGLIKGGNLANALVLEEKKYSSEEIKQVAEALGIEEEVNPRRFIFNPEGMRFSDEPARHKLLDLLGDLSLLGIPLRAKVIAKQPGHQGNASLVKHLKKELIEFKKLKNKPSYDPTKEPIFDLIGVRELLPHRYPFLLVDKIIELSEKQVVGIKNVTFNEGFFQGHFPDKPVFPGVLQMEALAQTGGILALSSVDDPQNWDTYFLKMDNVKFKNIVVPGDTLILKMELLTPIRRGIVHMQGTTYVGNKIVSEGELIAQIIRRK